MLSFLFFFSTAGFDMILQLFLCFVFVLGIQHPRRLRVEPINHCSLHIGNETQSSQACAVLNLWMEQYLK